MANLEDLLRDLASRGELSHISLAPSQGGKMWRGAFAMCSKFGISYAEDKDPAQALVLAMTGAKMKPRRASPTLKPEPEPEPEPMPAETFEDLM